MGGVKMDRISVTLTDFLLLRLINTPNIKRIEDPAHRRKVAYIEAWVSILGNILLAAFKMVFGLMLNSISMLADAVHTASDVLTSLVVILGFKMSAIPADAKHPHGHGRIEFIATLIIALMLLAVGVKFGYDSYQRFVVNTPVSGSYLIAVFMILAGLFKELMSRFSIELGNRICSSALIADAWHHRTDAIASLLVALAIVASKFGYYRVDAILGLAVSALIIWTGIEIFLDSCSKIIGETDNSQLNRISDLARNVPGVIATHDIAVHDYGSQKIISLHIEVDGTLTLIEANDIADKVEKTINQELFAVTTVHLDSYRDTSQFRQ